MVKYFFKNENSKGITLIALVITIVVMLILAGVTINLTLGENGIFTTAQQAAKNYTDSQNKEMAYLQGFTNEVDNIVNPAPLGTIIKTEDGINYTADGAGNAIPVPVGFAPITSEDQGTKATGFVIKNTTDGNEFVWVPVGSIENYTRVAWTKENWDFAQTLNGATGEIKRKDIGNTFVWTEKMPEDERDSVTSYGGFYIGRYEAGIKGGNIGEVLVDGTYYTGDKELVVQDNQQVWNYITRDKALTEATSLYNKVANNVISKLCSSYAWDSTLKFIEKQDSSYPTNSVGGNYLGATGKIQKTGYHSVNNIYDMAGNAYEWTTESFSNENSKYVTRGGDITVNGSVYPAAHRGSGSTSSVKESYRFQNYFVYINKKQ